MINYAELYGVAPNEQDFSGAVKRSLRKGVKHLEENFINKIRKEKENKL